MRYLTSSFVLLLAFVVLTGFKVDGSNKSPETGNIKLSSATSMVKVPVKLITYFDMQDTVYINAAGGEYESFQVVVSALDSMALTGIKWSVEALKGASGEIGFNNITVNPVGYVKTTVLGSGYPSKIGWYPDPLLRMDSFDIAAGERQPLWITIFVPQGTPAGTYTSYVHVESDSAGSADIPITLRVWGFDIPLTPSIKTLTWINGTSITNFGGDTRENRKRYYDLLLKHRLGPGGSVELDEDMLSFCIERGMNSFILDNIQNLKRAGLDSYSNSYKESLRSRLNNYVSRFGPRGWLNGTAFVFNYDEVPKEHWPLAKEMYTLIKSVSPDLNVLQCLANPDGVAALAGYADTWDIYIPHYEESGVKNRVAQGDGAWLSICCWPTDRPNLFHEYPAIDGRMLGWICYYTGVSGFEYWSPNTWDGNYKAPALRGNWKANTFGNYNGDGYLTYPSPDGNAFSSQRFANFRDGFEDYEYFNLLKNLGGNTDIIQQIVSDPMTYSSDPEALYRVRELVAQSIETIISGTKKIKSDTKEMSLSAYSNPASDQVTIEYRLNEPGQVALSLFDVSGKQLTTVEDGYKEIGVHKEGYNLTSLPDGLYFIRLIHQGRLETCKFLK